MMRLRSSPPRLPVTPCAVIQQESKREMGRRLVCYTQGDDRRTAVLSPAPPSPHPCFAPARGPPCVSPSSPAPVYTPNERIVQIDLFSYHKLPSTSAYTDAPATCTAPCSLPLPPPMFWSNKSMAHRIAGGHRRPHRSTVTCSHLCPHVPTPPPVFRWVDSAHRHNIQVSPPVEPPL